MRREYYRQGEYQGGRIASPGTGVAIGGGGGAADGAGAVAAEIIGAGSKAGQAVLGALAGEYRERQIGLVDDALLDVGREFEKWKKEYADSHQGALALNAQADFIAKYDELARARLKDFGQDNEIFRDLLRKRLSQHGAQAALAGGSYEQGQARLWRASQWEGQKERFRQLVAENPADSGAIEAEFNELVGSWAAKNPGLDPYATASGLWEEASRLRMETLLADDTRLDEAEALLDEMEKRDRPGILAAGKRPDAAMGKNQAGPSRPHPWPAGAPAGHTGGVFRKKLPDNVAALLREAALRHNVDEALLLSMAMQESGGDQSAVSRAGAIGVMQLMPATARSLGVNPADLAQNIDGGAREIASLLKKYGDTRLALLAYNWGQGNVDQWLRTGRGAKGQPMPGEAREYANAVGRHMGVNFDGEGAAANGRRRESPPNSIDYFPPGSGPDRKRDNYGEVPMSPEAAANRDRLMGISEKVPHAARLPRGPESLPPLARPVPEKALPVSGRAGGGLDASRASLYRRRIRDARARLATARQGDEALGYATAIYDETRGMGPEDRYLHAFDRLGSIPDLNMRRKASLILRQTYADEDRARKIRDDLAAHEILSKGEMKGKNYMTILAECKAAKVSQPVIDRLEEIRAGKASRPTIANMSALRDGLIAIDRGLMGSAEERIVYAFDKALTIQQREQLLNYEGSQSGVSFAEFEEMLKRAGYDRLEWTPDLYKVLPELLKKGKVASRQEIEAAVLSMLWKGVNGERWADARLFMRTDEWEPEIPSSMRERYVHHLRRRGLSTGEANVRRSFYRERFPELAGAQTFDRAEAEEGKLDLSRHLPWDWEDAGW